VEDITADEHHSAIGDERSNVAYDCQEGGHRTSGGNEEHVAVLHSDPDTDEVRACYTEEIENIRSSKYLAGFEGSHIDAFKTVR
jgi:hypothetical protein